MFVHVRERLFEIRRSIIVVVVVVVVELIFIKRECNNNNSSIVFFSFFINILCASLTNLFILFTIVCLCVLFYIENYFNNLTFDRERKRQKLKKARVNKKIHPRTD